MNFGNGAQRRGFSLIEVIAVLVLLTVLAAVAAGTLSRSAAPVTAAADQLASHLRYVQARALADVGSWELTVTSAISYEVPRVGGSAPVDLVGGVELSGGVAEIRFDQWGRPVDGAGTPLAGETLLTVSDGTHVRTVRILAGTGYIEVQ